MTQEEIKESKGKPGYRTVVIDTINQIQNDLYVQLLNNKSKATFDDWKDFGIEILDLYSFIKSIAAFFTSLTSTFLLKIQKVFKLF